MLCLRTAANLDLERYRPFVLDLPQNCKDRTYKGKLWSGPRQADRVMDEITVVDPWERWLGPAGLKRVYVGIFGVVEHGFKSPDPPEPDPCPKCRDRGHRYVIIIDGRAQWCDCDGARTIKESDPDWLRIRQDALDSEAAVIGNRSKPKRQRDISDLLTRI
jgi:hypothetical protein